MKFIQKIFYILLSILFLWFLYNSFFYGKALKNNIFNTTITWFYYIVPSISISYTTAILLYNYPLISKLLYKPLHYIYHFENRKSCSIYLISIIVGNPCSIKLITEAVSNNEISITEGNRLLRFSSFVSTIFLFSIFEFNIAVTLFILEILNIFLWIVLFAWMIVCLVDFFYFFNHLSNQPKNVRCHRIPFCGFSTQWFSSGKSNSCAGIPRRRAALNAAIDCDESMR